MTPDIETQKPSLGSHDITEEKTAMTDPEWTNLRRVPDTLPKIALLILAVEVSAPEMIYH
jgi:POT family proton-dependent oligopeptide transporter